MKEIVKAKKKYNYLIAIKFGFFDKNGAQSWLFKCDCGNEKIIIAKDVKSGHTKSCGCLNSKLSAERKRTHGMRYTRTYKSWCSMIQRCLNKNYIRYKDYGGRGITVCEEWTSKNGFINFYRDMGKRPESKTLDRINNNLGYCKSNCKWSTVEDQNNNKRKRLGVIEE